MRSPPQPDYASLAQQQGQINLDTAKFNARASRPDVYNPYGSQVWSNHPSDPDRMVLNENLSPAEQAKLEAANRIQQSGLGSVEAALPMIHQAIAGGGFQLPGEAQTGFLPGHEPKWGVQHGIGSIDDLAKIQSGVDLSKLGAMPGADAATRDRYEKELLSRHTKSLDPQFAQKQNDLENQLANQGISRGSEAWNREMDNFNRTRESAYDTARTSSILGGGQEMSMQHGLGMANRQQGWAEMLQNLIQNNSARQQGLGERMDLNRLWNENVGQDFNQELARTQQYNQGRGQQFQENMQGRLAPINIMASMLGMGQVNSPNFQPYNNNIQAEGAPVFQGGLASYAAGRDRANAQNSMIGQGMGAAASIAGAFIL